MPTEYIDMTPTWEAVLPIYLAAIKHGDYDGSKAAMEELTRMAKLADLYIAEKKANKA